MIKNESYTVIQGWMINELKLSGKRLIVYALIHGFSQDGKTRFKGSSSHIAEWLGATKKTTLLILKELTENGYIKKYKSGPRGREKCDYGVNFEKIKNISGNKITPQNDLRLQNYTASGNKITPPSGNKITHHINSHIYNNSSSTTTFSKFYINKQKEQKLCTGLDPSWLEGINTYPEFIAEAVQENYPDKPQDQKNRLFLTLFSAEDRKAMFPQWRQEKETEAKNIEVKAEQEKAFKNHPTKCEICGNDKLREYSESYQCLSCYAISSFNKDTMKWEWRE